MQPTNPCASFPQLAKLRDGVLFFEDGTELKLWGVNFQSCLYWEQGFRREPLGLPGDAASIKAMADCGFAEIQMIGCECIRAHLTPSDYTDEKGNLIDNQWLDLIGYTLAKARDAGLYVTLAFLNQMEYSLVPGSFIAKCPRKEWLFDADCVAASHHFIRQLLNWVNPYTGLALKDDHVIVAWEAVNEPEYIFYNDMKANSAYREEFRAWVDERGGAFNDWYFSQWREEKVRLAIDAFHDLIRGQGAMQPMIWNCNWPRMWLRHEDVFRGIAASKTEAVSFCCYPGQDEVSEPFLEGAADTSRKNYLPFLQRCYEDHAHLGWLNSPQFRAKAVTVYEFETMYNAFNSYLYPAMAKLFRSLRAQMATLWTWSFSDYAEWFSGSHLFGIEVTPAKAAGFAVAGEIFRKLSRGGALSFSSEDDDRFEGFVFSQREDVAVCATEGLLMYSNTIQADVLPSGFVPRRVIGRGCSPFVETDGTGLYILELGNVSGKLVIFPKAEFVREPWRWWIDRKPVAKLHRTVAISFRMLIPGWESADIKRIDGSKIGLAGLANNLLPGCYRIDFT